jgi:alpha-galactosidase
MIKFFVLRHLSARFLLILGLSGFLSVNTFAQSPQASAIKAASDWATAKFTGSAFGANDDKPFFSFVYGGKPSAELLPTWKVERSSTKLDANRTQYTITYTDSASGLLVRCVGILYGDYPTVEWTVYFKNTGDKDSPILENVQALDTEFPDQKLLHAFEGAHASPTDYHPNDFPFSGGTVHQSYNPGSGRGSDQTLPYFNLECGDGGVIIAVGWPGQWQIDFDQNKSVKAGQQLVHLVLHPGEEIRTPLMALQFWKEGDWIDAQNVWRRWMVAHSTQKKNGKPLPPQMNACSSHQFGEMIHANEENQIQFIDGYLAHGIKIDYWWMDAGWYVNNGTWQNVGTWEVDAKRFPKGLRAVSDHGHEVGVNTIVWFEPERVTAGTYLWDNHADWLLGSGDNRLLNLGNPDAWKWLTDHVDKVITDQGIDLYRQDFNIEPLNLWRANDAPDRQGMTENKYITGYLAYWDELQKRHPGMLIDSCASGGRRNDLETMRRAVPLLRSDAIFVPTDQQGHTYGASFWLPYQGTGAKQLDSYIWRSCMVWSQTDCFDIRDANANWVEAKRLYDQWREVSPLFISDYYPLTPYSQSPTDWIAWQFNRPEKGDGLIEAFRHDQVDKDTNQFKLRGLLPDATYTVTNIDDSKTQKLTGRQLMDDGVAINVPTKPGAAFYTYARTP